MIKIESKNFLFHFVRFLVYDLLRLMSCALRFCQMKDRSKIYICGKFHHYSFCGCEVKRFRVFGWALTPPNIVQSCWNFDQRLSPIRKTLLKESFEILNFSINRRHPKFTVLVLFRAQFTTGKPKILLKTKIITKTTSLGISNSVRSRTQKNHRILVILNKKETFVWAQTGSTLPLFPFSCAKALS